MRGVVPNIARCRLIAETVGSRCVEFWLAPLGKRGSILNSTVKQVLIWVLAVAFLLVSWQFVSKNMSPAKEKTISLSTLQMDGEAGKIADVTINGTAANGKYKDGTAFNTTVPPMYP